MIMLREESDDGHFGRNCGWDCASGQCCFSDFRIAGPPLALTHNAGAPQHRRSHQPDAAIVYCRACLLPRLRLDEHKLESFRTPARPHAGRFFDQDEALDRADRVVIPTRPLKGYSASWARSTVKPDRAMPRRTASSAPVSRHSRPRLTSWRRQLSFKSRR